MCIKPMREPNIISITDQTDVLICYIVLLTTGYLALNDNKIKHYISSTIKSIREINISSSNTGLMKFLMCSTDLNIGITSGTTHIKTILSSSPGSGKHFTGNIFCSSDDSVMQFIHILHLFMINVFYKPCKKKIQSQLWRLRGPGDGGPLSITNNQEAPCPERHEHNNRSEVVHHLLENCSHRDFTQSSILHHS